MDGQVAGWVFLPDDGPRMHRTDGTGVGRTLCGHHLDPTVPVLQDPRRVFSICVACRDAGAQYPIPQPAARVVSRGSGWWKARGSAGFSCPNPR
jgi:hypothetical protein